MKARTSFSPTIQTLLDSRRTSIYGFCGGGSTLVHLACFNTFYKLSVSLVLVTENSPRVENIFCVGTPFQIIFVAIQFVSVLVINFGKIVRIGDKCFGNELVYSLDIFAEVE